MIVKYLDILFVTFVVLTFTDVAYAETRYVCIRRVGGGGDMDEIGEMENEMEMDEAFEADEMNEIEGDEGGMAPMMGKLDCANKPNTVIMVTKLIYGSGGMVGCSSPDETCDAEAFSDQEISPQCDGKQTCDVTAVSRPLPKCLGRQSDFIHVEYECIKPNSLHDICKEANTVVNSAYFFIQSPNKSNYPTGGFAMCECIMRSRFSDALLMEYTHINMLDSSSPTGAPSTSSAANNGGNCKDNYILFESRSKPNQTGIDNRLQICGRKTVSNKIFRGSLRITFASKSMFSDEGFLTKLQVKLLNGAAMVNLQCGTVDLPPNSPLLVNNQAGQTGFKERNNLSPFGPIQQMFPGVPGVPGGVPNPLLQLQMQAAAAQAPFFPHPFNGKPFEGRGTPRNRANFGLGGSGPSSNQQLPAFNQNPSKRWDSNVSPVTVSTVGVPPSLQFIGRGNSRSSNRLQAFEPDIKEVEVKTNKNDAKREPATIAYILGGTGAALFAVCAIVIVLVYSRRKKTYERHRDVHPMASFRNSGRRRVHIDLDPVYTSPAEIDDRRHRVSTQVHSNSAYVGDLPERSRPRYDEPYNGNDMDMEGYSTVGLASRDETEAMDVVNAHASGAHAMANHHDYDNNIRRDRR